MSKKKGSKKSNFFHDASLKLNREIKQERAQDAKEAKKGFINEMNQLKERDPEIYANAKQAGQLDNLFKGEDVIKNKKPIEALDLDRSKPSDHEAGQSESTFYSEQSRSLYYKGVK